MKASITFEVPDDFKKGECHKCPFSERKEGAYSERCTLTISFDCPIEIQKVKKMTQEERKRLLGE